jgi:hypothetical protein
MILKASIVYISFCFVCYRYRYPGLLLCNELFRPMRPQELAFGQDLLTGQLCRGIEKLETMH